MNAAREHGLLALVATREEGGRKGGRDIGW
jgi:hypothetical protein